jgi:hypothetical protein
MAVRGAIFDLGVKLESTNFAGFLSLFIEQCSNLEIPYSGFSSLKAADFETVKSSRTLD